MVRKDCAECVARARQLLKSWDAASDDSPAHVIRATLATVFANAGTLPAAARAKLDEVDRALKRVRRATFDERRREALDTLMLGLWVRLETGDVRNKD